jgi:hypothetical protein
LPDLRSPDGYPTGASAWCCHMLQRLRQDYLAVACVRSMPPAQNLPLLRRRRGATRAPIDLRY